MKRILLVGHVACGKTTLCQCLNGLELAGASPIFTVSARTGQGIPQFRRFLEEDPAPLSP